MGDQLDHIAATIDALNAATAQHIANTATASALTNDKLNGLSKVFEKIIELLQEIADNTSQQ